MAPARAPRHRELAELVEAHRSEIEERLERHPLDDEGVDLVLDRAFTHLLLRWEKISDRRAWLLDELDRACLWALERGELGGEIQGPSQGATAEEGGEENAP